MSQADELKPTDDAQEAFAGLTSAVWEAEVPVSEAVVGEVTDYAVYVCGMDCYQRWLKVGK
jgi:hypothetical protein